MKKLVVNSETTHAKKPPRVAHTRDTYLRWIGWPVWLVVSYGLTILVASAAFELAARLNPQLTTAAPMVAMAFRVVVYLVLALLFIYVPIFMIAREKFTAREMGLAREMRWRDIMYGTVGFVLFMPVAFVVMQLAANIPGLNATEAQDLGLGMTYGHDRMAAFILLVMITPFFEEWIFRGALYGKLRAARMPWWLTALIVSVLFGAAHGQWNVGITTFCMSVVVCGLREKTGTIWAGVILHIIKNLIAFYMVFVSGVGGI